MTSAVTPTGTGAACASDEAFDVSLRERLEAIVMASDSPVVAADVAVSLGVSETEVTACLKELAGWYSQTQRGFELREVSGGWQIATRPDLHDDVAAHMHIDSTARLSQAALETLAVVAYRQPISRARVAAIRGVNVDGVMRTLVSRGLIAQVPHDEPGIGQLFGTTPYFLERLGLASIDQLPPLAPHLPDDSQLDDLAGEMP